MTGRHFLISLTLFLSSGAFADLCPFYARLQQLGHRTTEGHGPPEFWTLDGPKDARKANENAFRNLYKELGVTEYDHYFENWLRERQRQQKTTHVLDLFGGGFFVEDQSLASSITGARFGPYAREELPPDYPASKIPTEVLGDLMNPTAWARIDQSLKERGIPGLDLVLMNPNKGWAKLGLGLDPEKHALAIAFLVKNAQQRLNKDGRFYFAIDLPQLPNRFLEEQALSDLQAEINRRGTHKLVLKPVVRGGLVWRLEGVLLPK